MVTKVSALDQQKEAYGLPTDEKPLDMPNGSRFFEMKTSKIYMFDEENKIWYEWVSQNAQ